MENSKRPRVGYHSGFDPTININSWVNRLTDINILTTKVLSDEFIDICVANKHRIYLHIVINGMGKTMLEPNIGSVKLTFTQIKHLISRGFPVNQILIIVNPIIQNDNGLNALKLLLKLFTQFKDLRLRYVRFELLKYYSPTNKKKETIDNYSSITNTNPNLKQWFIANRNITKRLQYNSGAKELLVKATNFYGQYKQLLRSYSGVIIVDEGTEPIIGTRELKQFGFTNRFKNAFGVEEKIIRYHKNNKNKPIVDVNLSNPKPVRCRNRCLLCPYQ